MDHTLENIRNDEAAKPTSMTIKRLIERTPSAIKSRFLTVLGNSSDLFSGISNKIDAALTLSSSSEETETTNNRNEMKVQAKLEASKQTVRLNTKEVDMTDYDNVDFDYRKVKERRAIEEIQCGGYRQPTFVVNKSSNLGELESNNFKNVLRYLFLFQGTTPNSLDLLEVEKGIAPKSNISTETDDSNSIYSPSPRPEIDIDFLDQVNVVKMAITSSLPEDEREPSNFQIAGRQDFLNSSHSINRLAIPSSSASTSDNDPCIADVSFESADLKNWIRSESYTSVPSWASSFSLDSQSEEAALEFMKNFNNALFTNPASITVEMKSEFGQYARTENGRLWFSRLLNVQRVKSKKVDELTFYALVQFFAIVLFECVESDDFPPAKTLMNMCFTFYHEVDVPGCEPYPEYLYTYLKDQTIWHSLRFWNAAFFDALQSQRAQRCGTSNVPNNQKKHEDSSMNKSANDGSSIDSVTYNEIDLEEEKQFLQNITFGQLGTFTCNMHAFGLGRDLTNEFLRKQCTINNLTKEQVQLLQDNVNRMYRETDPWRKQ
uniref:CSON011440 protein n=1 Tax=Culicoides sonorensis TaxID=179676 RepID=A0A336LLH1_CULSO